MLGVYIGDGYLAHNGNSWMLRVVLDDAYPAIANECCEAIEALRGGSRPTPRHDPNGERCLSICSTWRRWICLFPQHGPGHKHERDIDAAPGPFVRGLLHTDGWRGVNRVRAKGKDYEYPRYQFSNRSDDIRKLFTYACDRMGVEWRPWTRYHVSVARRESVALLDTFVGPKS
jgi:hypothetical protein